MMRNTSQDSCVICGEQTTNIVLISNDPRFMCKKHSDKEIIKYIEKTLRSKK